MKGGPAVLICLAFRGLFKVTHQKQFKDNRVTVRLGYGFVTGREAVWQQGVEVSRMDGMRMESFLGWVYGAPVSVVTRRMLTG